MHAVRHVGDRAYEFVHVPVFHDQGWSSLDDHEIVAAHLRENAAIPEETHYHQLPEHSGVDVLECFKGNSQTELPWRGVSNSIQQTDASNLLHHLITR